MFFWMIHWGWPKCLHVWGSFEISIGYTYYLITIVLGCKVSKIPSKDKSNDEVDFTYSFVRDGHVFNTEGATLRWVIW